MDSREVNEIVVKLLAAADKIGDREILHLVCVEEMSYAETARILDIPLGTVMSRLSRARLALSERLGIR